MDQLRVMGPVAPIEVTPPDGTPSPLPEDIAEKIRGAAQAFVRSEIPDTEDVVVESAEDDDSVLVLVNPITAKRVKTRTRREATKVILQDVDEDALIQSILDSGAGLQETAIRELIQAEAAKAHDDAIKAELAKAEIKRADEEARRRARAEEDAARAERRRIADEEARILMDAEKAKEAEAERRVAAHRAQLEELGRQSSPAPIAAPVAQIDDQNGEGAEPAHAPAPRPSMERTEWDSVEDHRMSRRAQNLWRVAVYCTCFALPASIFVTSPYSPADTLAHHVAGFGCQFSASFGMVNVPEGEPGYHPRNDADGDGVACEKKAPRSATLAAGGARFVRPQ